jgi:hypothetical protein
MTDDDPFNLNGLALTEEQVKERLAVVPRKIQKRRQQFVMVPWTWRERLEGAPGQTILLALDLVYLSWKNKEEPIKLANAMLQHDGISRQSKWRALNELERRGLVRVERRPRRSPLVYLSHF